jgi:hypothetical protein
MFGEYHLRIRIYRISSLCIGIVWGMLYSEISLKYWYRAHTSAQLAPLPQHQDIFGCYYNQLGSKKISYI